MKMNRNFLVIPAIVAGGFLLASCGQFGNDAPTVTGEAGDRTPAEIYAMPDGFSNFATKCDKYGNRVYTLYHADGAYGSIAVSPQDPSCKK
jgi:hypothetical protein